MLKKLNQLLAKLPSFLLPALCFILLFVVLNQPTLAAGPDQTTAVPETFLQSLGGFAKIYSSVILVIVMLTYVFALMVGDLIDSTFILDTGMGDTLHMVWSVVRNFVNIGFILVLLVIAAMVVFGGAGDKGLGMLKKVLPKFILALVFVNFTFFAGRFILTTNDVLATAIFALPKTVAGDRMINLPCAPGLSAEACRDEIMKTVTGSYAGDQEIGKDLKEKLTTNIQKLQNTMAEHKIADTIDKKNVALLLVSSMLDLKNLVSSKGVLGGSWDTAISGIMAIITAGAVGIVIFMLMLALIVRMVVLWMCLALSPVAALAVVLGDVIPGANLKGDLDLLGIFIKHAFMPTLVSIPLSIGLIMIFTNNTIKPDSGGVLGSIGGSAGAGNFNSLLWWIASIIIIWFGVNTMIKKSSEYASKITDKIHGGVNSAAGTVAGTLKYAPILPSWNGGGNRSLASYTQIPRDISSLMEAQSSNRANEDAKRAAPAFGYEPQKMNPATFNQQAKGIQTTTVAQLIAAINGLVKQGLTRDSNFDNNTAGKFFENNKTALEEIGIKSAEALKEKSVQFILDQIKHSNPAMAPQVKTAEDGLDKNDSDFNSSPADDNKPEDKTDVKNALGIEDLSRFGEKINQKDINEADVEKKEFNINGSVVYKIKDKSGKVLLTKKIDGGTDAQGKKVDDYFEVLGAESDFDKPIDQVDNDDGAATANLLANLKKSKALLSPEQIAKIKENILGGLNAGKITSTQLNDLEGGVRNFFDDEEKDKTNRDDLLKAITAQKSKPQGPNPNPAPTPPTPPPTH